LLAGSIAIGGSLGVGGVADLVAGTGGITETGSLTAGTLTGSAATTARFGGTNRIATLADFAAPGGFSLTDGQALTVAGSVTAASGTIALDTGTFGLDVPGAISGLGATLLAGSIAIGGSLGVGGVADLVAGTGGITETGSLTAGTLVGSAVTAALFTGSNQVGALANFTAPDGFTLLDGQALSVAGTVLASAGTIVLDTGTFGLSVPGAISGLAATLAAGSIGIAGRLAAGGMAALFANQGGIQETGVLTAGTLSGSAVTTASFTGANRVGTLADFTAGSGFNLLDGESLTVAGLVASSGGTVAIDTGTFGLAVPGGINALAATLAAGSIDLPGSVNVAGIADVTASSGAITESGTLIAGTLTGSVSTNAAFTGSNTIATLADFVAPGGLTLLDTRALAVLGRVSSGGNVLLDTEGSPLSVQGTITGAAATLVAGSIDLPGAVGVAGLLVLSAGGGNITESGAISAAALTGSASSANLVGANRIGTLAAFDAGSLALDDAVALTVAGPVTIGSSVAIDDAGALTVSGNIDPRSGNAIAVALTGDTIAITGGVSDGGSGTTALVATDGAITETGALVAGTLSGSASGGGAGFAGVTLTGANRIATLGNFTATGDMLIEDSTNLVIAGSVFGGTHGGLGGAGSASVEIDVLGGNAGLTVAQGAVVHAGVDGALTGNVTLRAGNDGLGGGVEIDGGVYAAHGGAVMVTAGYNVGSNAWNVVGSGSDITLTGTIWGDMNGGAAAGSVFLGAAGSIDEPVTQAAIGADLLTGRAGGHVNLAETANGALAPVPSANRIATLGNFFSNTGTDDPLGFLLRDGQGLTVTGSVVDGGGSASRGVAISVVPGSGGSYTAGDLVIAGLLQAQTTVNPQATGNVIEQPGGRVVARTLTTQSGVIPSTETAGNAPGSYPATIIAANASAFYGNAAVPNANQVGTLTNVTTTGTLSLFDSQDLTVLGNLVTGVTETAGTIVGTVAVGNGMTLVTPGALSVSGILDVASQGGVLSLSGNTVALGDGNGTATLKAATIQVSAATGVTAAPNTLIYTGGDVFRRPAAGTAPVDPGPATPGAHILTGTGGFTQTGFLDVLPYTATTGEGSVVTVHPELDIRLTQGGGLVSFDPLQGLNAPTTSLLLSLGDTGRAQGKILADSLAVFYLNTIGGPTQLSATFFTAGGVEVAGQAAASQSFIAKNGLFVPSNHFQVNACAVSSINCILISPFATLPLINPLKDLPTDFLSEEDNDPDLLIPNVSDRED
ncbi:MAG TPA: hypothetical protein VHB27_00565, partial [Rhodopila sp.]|uniref:beta strand repeat-containing protein n=1 Tax=Rhodopila sp. TaxID=2480087 RepID=UPI002B7F2DFA